MKKVFCTALLLGGSGCFVPVTQGKAMEQDIRALRDRLVAVEDRAESDDAVLRERVAQAQRDAERIRETMDKVDKIARRADANFGEELEALRRAMGAMQGRLETMEHQTGKVSASNPESQALRKDLSVLSERLLAVEKLVAALQQQLVKKAVKPTPKVVAKVPPTKKEVPAKGPQAKVDESSRGLFRAGRDALRDRRYGRARELLERWITLYGKKRDKRSALDDAYVFVGESWQNQKKYQKAIHAYKSVYKMGESKADMWTKAVFRMGECFQALGDKAGARAFFKIANSKGRGHFAKKSGQRLKRLR